MTPAGPVVIDFDGILSQYTGNAILDRLLCIAESTSSVDVAREALQKTKSVLERVDEFSKPVTLNEVAYERARALARELHINDVEFKREWLEDNSKRARAELEKLDSELSDLLAERVNENLRMQFVELGDHYYDRGDLKNAVANYMRTRDYCSTPKHIVSTCLNVMAVSLEMKNFAHVNIHATKAHNALDEIAHDDGGVNILRAKVFCASGIANLRMNRYKDAALSFTSVPLEIGTSYANVCSARDVALYGTLCALATFNRTELLDLVLNNKKSAFRAHLEAASDVREVVNNFYDSKYTTCFAALDGMRLLLTHDLHLREHVAGLYKRIRERALIQYCQPYISVDLEVMASAFNTSSGDLQLELATLIESEKISARIDCQSNTLTASSANTRTAVLAQIIADGEHHERETRSALLRLSLLRHDVVVRAPNAGDDDGLRAGVKPSRAIGMDLTMASISERHAMH